MTWMDGRKMQRCYRNVDVAAGCCYLGQIKPEGIDLLKRDYLHQNRVPYLKYLTFTSHISSIPSFPSKRSSRWLNICCNSIGHLLPSVSSAMQLSLSDPNRKAWPRFASEFHNGLLFPSPIDTPGLVPATHVKFNVTKIVLTLL